MNPSNFFDKTGIYYFPESLATIGIDWENKKMKKNYLSE